MLPGRPRPRPPRLEEVDDEDVRRGHEEDEVHEDDVHLAENETEPADRQVENRLKEGHCLCSCLRPNMVGSFCHNTAPRSYCSGGPCVCRSPHIVRCCLTYAFQALALLLLLLGSHLFFIRHTHTKPGKHMGSYSSHSQVLGWGLAAVTKLHKQNRNKLQKYLLLGSTSR